MEDIYFNLSDYCAGRDFTSALQMISEDLTVVNFPPVEDYDRDNPGKTISSLINTVWTLLQHRQQFVDSQHQLDKKVHLLSQDLNNSKEKLKHMEKRLLETQHSVDMEKRKIILAEIEQSEVLKDTKSIKREMEELKLRLKDKECQFKHELQRQQNENAELQSKLRKILSREKGDKWKGPIDNSEKHKLDDFEKSKCVDLLYQKNIHRLENNVHCLVKENLELRKLLDSVSEDVAQLMAQTSLYDKPTQGYGVT